MKLRRIKIGGSWFGDSIGEGSAGWLLLPVQRLRTARLSTVLFYLFGLLMVFAWMGTFSIEVLKQTEFIPWVIYSFTPICLIAATLFVAQHIAVGNVEDMTSRPLKFLAVMLCATVAVYGVMGIYDWALHIELYRWFRDNHRFPDFFRFAIFFALIGWLSCLYRQRQEGEAKFAMLSIRRSMLSRELAQSRLMAARSRIDPRMVVRVLKKIHALYRTDPDVAPELMDHLIAYLRLAMNREREKAPSVETDISIAKAYFALREAETGRRIDFRASFHDRPAARKEKPAVPVFLVLQKIFESSASGNSGSMAIHVDVLETSIAIVLEIGVEPFSDTALERLRRNLIEIVPLAGDILHHISESGEHRYAVDIPFESRSSHRPDR